jgi:hypothetical protein
MFEQVLATGVHGILLPRDHRRGGESLRRSGALSNHEQGVGPGGQDGRRAHGAATASKIWGISDLQKADVWPLNPNGDIARRQDRRQVRFRQRR